jgi:hypothetical protein
MSRRTIRAVDLLCDVMNWNSSLPNAHADEVARWTQKRDRKLAALREAIASFTPDDIAYLQRKAPKTIEDMRTITKTPPG